MPDGVDEGRGALNRRELRNGTEWNEGANHEETNTVWNTREYYMTRRHDYRTPEGNEGCGGQSRREEWLVRKYD